MPGRHSHARFAVGALAAALPLAGLIVTGSLPALASGPAPVCGARTCTVTYTSPGSGQSFTVPAGVSDLAVTLYGAQGGSATVYNEPIGIDDGDSDAGGAGAKVTAQVAVTAGTTLGVDVGGAGGTAAQGDSGTVPGGINGGGPSAATDAAGGNFSGAGEGGGGGGGGGGATDLATSPAGNTVLVEAGGGGGAGLPAFSLLSNVELEGPCLPLSDDKSGPGGNAGTQGATGATEPTPDNGGAIAGGGGGHPGTTSGPGGAGVAGALTGDVGTYCMDGQISGAGTGGAQGSGRTGGTGPVFGGGGGGGYFGGGSGGSGAVAQFGASTAEPVPGGFNYNTTIAAGGGGGGGASFTGGTGVTAGHVIDAGNAGAINDGNGEAILSFADPIITGSPTYTTGAGQPVTVGAASGLLSASGAGTVAPAGDALASTGPAGGKSAGGGTVTVHSDGSFSYVPATGFAGLDTFGYTVSGPAGLSVTGVATVQVLFAPQTITFTSRPQAKPLPGHSYAVTATGGAGGAPITYSVPGYSAAACSISGSTVTFTAGGSCTVDANRAGRGIYAPAPQISQVIKVDQAPKLVLAAPGRSAATGHAYGYVFAAEGTPGPVYALAHGAPAWLSVDHADGQVSGTPPTGTKSFSYSIRASNAAGRATAGPFKVTVGKPAPGADLKLTVSCPATLTLASKKTCTLTVTDHGPSAATGVTVAVALPAGLTKSACGSGCIAQGNLYRWQISKLAKGASKSFTITVQATAAGPGQVLATADGTSYDPNTTSNVVAATVLTP